MAGHSSSCCGIAVFDNLYDMAFAPFCETTLERTVVHPSPYKMKGHTERLNLDVAAFIVEK